MEKKTKKGPNVPIEVTEAKDYRVVYSTGVFGGLNPSEGKIISFWTG